MIDSGHPMRHAVIVCIFCTKCEFLEATPERCGKLGRAAAQSPISWNGSQRLVAVSDQARAIVILPEEIALGRGRIGDPKSGPHKIVVQIRGADGKLGLLQSQKPVLMPWGLPERCK